MIKSIYSQNLEQKNTVFEFKTSSKNVSLPLQLQMVNQKASNYSLNNLKANYMPIAFRGDTAEGNNITAVSKEGIKASWFIPKPKAKINVTDLPKDSRYVGDYWSEFSDDLAVVLKSDKCVKLEYDESFEPEIFVHSFANHFSIKKNEHGIDTKVFFIPDSQLAAQEAADIDAISKQAQKNKGTIDLRTEKKLLIPDIITVSPFNLLMDISKEGTKRNIVFVKDYEYLEDKLPVFFNKKYSSVREYLHAECPNVSIVDLSIKQVDKNASKVETGPALAKLQLSANVLGMELVEKRKKNKNILELEMPNMSTSAVKEFFKKNPEVVEGALTKYSSEAEMKISQEAMDMIVDKAALIVDDSFGVIEGALRILDMTAAAKINEKSSGDVFAELRIDKPFVKKFFLSHSSLIDLFKGEKTSRFAISENISTSLKDVGGIGEVKQKIQEELIEYLKNPKKYIAENGFAPKGILLEGPTGTGKTLIARAIAGETSTPFISVSGSEFVEMYVGMGASRMRELFAKAKKAAEASANKTAIIFVDEFDALATARSGGSGGDQEHSQTLNQFLIELDGFDNKESKTKIVVLAATNRKDMLDSAAIRAGRFDDSYKIGNPDTPEKRLEILNIHAKNFKFKNDAEETKILDEAKMMTENMSGAEIAEVLKKAQKVVAKRSENKFITMNDLVEGFLQVIAGPLNKISEDMPLEEVIETVRHEGGHATIIDCLKPMFNEKISFITLNPRGNFLGAVIHTPKEKRTPNFKSVILSAAVSYGGGLAEPGFESVGRSAGVSQDLKNATRLFRKAITEWGQGVFTPAITLISDSEEVQAAKEFYETMRKINEPKIEKDVLLFSKTSEKIAKMINDFHSGFLDAYVEKFKNNTGKGGNDLSGEEFAKMRQEWLVKNGKADAEKELLRKIERMLDDAYNSNKGIIERLAKKVAHSVK